MNSLKYMVIYNAFISVFMSFISSTIYLSRGFLIFMFILLCTGVSLYDRRLKIMRQLEELASLERKMIKEINRSMNQFYKETNRFN